MLVKRKPKVYAEAAKEKGPMFYDYENNVNLIWSVPDNYACDRKIGRGKYSEVFEGVSLRNSQKCVVKILKPIKSKKINREIKILQALGGEHNCVKLYDIVKDDDIACLVFEHVQTMDFKSLIQILTDEDCRYYIYQVLKGLEYCHSMGIMHRDIKPQNVMIDHSQRKLRIIDWGLGEFYLPLQDYNVRVSSRYYKGPELLVGYEFYHYSLDIWSLGVMMAGMIFKREPFFKGADNYDQLEQINRVLGTDDLFRYVDDYNIRLQKAYDSILGKHHRIPWQKFITPDNEALCSHEALDLLTKMLSYDHNSRPTARECMQHPYFSKIHHKG